MSNFWGAVHIGGRYDNFNFKAGKAYTFTVSTHAHGTNGIIFVISDAEVTEVPPAVPTGLAVETGATFAKTEWASDIRPIGRFYRLPHGNWQHPCGTSRHLWRRCYQHHRCDHIDRPLDGRQLACCRARKISIDEPQVPSSALGARFMATRPLDVSRLRLLHHLAGAAGSVAVAGNHDVQAVKGHVA